MDNLDFDLENLKNEKIEVPSSVLNKVNESFYKIREPKKKNNSKRILKIAIVFAAILSISFAKPVSANLKKIFLNPDNKGIEKAIENNYIQKISEKSFKTSDFNLNLDKVLVDSTNIMLTYKLSFEDKSKISKLDLENLTFSSDVTLKIDNKPVDISFTQYSVENSNNNTLILSAIFRTSKLNKAKNLSINLGGLKLSTSDKDKCLYYSDSSFNSNIKLDDKFSSKEDIKYKVKSSSKNIIVNEVTATKTGLFVDLEYLALGHDENLLENIKLLSNSKEYKSSFGEIGSKDNKDTVKITFSSPTSFDNLESFKIEIKNPDGISKDTVELSK